MNSPRILSQAELGATFTNPMHRVPVDAEPPFDFWDYFDCIPESHFEGHDCKDGAVDYAYNSVCGRYSHVLVNSSTKNVFMVLVLDLQTDRVHGHRILDLNAEYGIAAQLSERDDG